MAVSPEPHISDVTSGNVVVCAVCGGANIKDSVYCRECGRSLSAVKISLNGAKDDFAETTPAIYEANPAPAEVRALPAMPSEPLPPEPRNGLLEKLDVMELELEAKKQEPLPEPERKIEADKLDEYEETLKSIAFTLDTLISDLLKAEAQEYASSDLPRADGKSFPKKSADAKRGPLKMRARNLQEIIVMIALIAAIFLVGMTFGLWGSYFFGI
jgi:hypothetical protein